MLQALDKDHLRKTLECIEGRVRKEINGSQIPRKLASRLKEICQAMERLDTDRYGFCEQCFLVIPWRELTLAPERRLCERCT